MNTPEIEIISAEIHKCYCRAYERRFCKPYWTNGDYSKLDEPTKDYDREMAAWVIADRAKIVEPLVELKEKFKSGVPVVHYQIAIDESLRRAGRKE